MQDRRRTIEELYHTTDQRIIQLEIHTIMFLKSIEQARIAKNGRYKLIEVSLHIMKGSVPGNSSSAMFENHLQMKVSIKELNLKTLTDRLLNYINFQKYI